MINKELVSALEAILFACGSPVDSSRLLDITEVTKQELDEALDELKRLCDEPSRGVTLVKIEDAYQLCTKPIAASYVKKALQMRKVPPLSKASLEVLAIIAYNQPVTRLFVEQVRGVDSSYIIASLCDKALIAERGTLDAPGRPTLFGTTDNFLRCFGLTSLSDLPQVDFTSQEGDGQTTIDAIVEESE